MTTWSKFIDSLNENRVLVASVAGVAAALILYRVLAKGKEQVAKKDEKDIFLHDIEVLKERLNLESLGKDDLKQIQNFMVNQTHKRLLRHNAVFKKERRTLRNADFQHYARAVVDWISKMQNITVQVNSDVLRSLGISEQRFNLATMQHPELMSYMPTFDEAFVFRQLSLEETHKALKFQKTYLFYHGQELTDNIKMHSDIVDSSAAKQVLPMLFNIAINDERYSALGFQEEQVEEAVGRYRKQIAMELAEIQQEVNPLIMQLTSLNKTEAEGMGDEDEQAQSEKKEKTEPQLQEDFMKMMGVDPSLLEGFDPELLGFEHTPRKEPESQQQQAGEDGEEENQEGDEENQDPNQEGDQDEQQNQQEAEEGNEQNGEGEEEQQEDEQQQGEQEEEQGYQEQSPQEQNQDHPKTESP